MNELGAVILFVTGCFLVSWVSFNGGIDKERQRAVEAGVAEYFVPKGETKPEFRYLVTEDNR